ncbi:MAG: HYR domain-containing protein, partial [Saprospiraceae bacterium]|nr:HYR domain-containing protein [Saprospiraceae bacterium]
MPASFPKKHPVLLFLLFIFLIFQTPLIGQATYDANGASSAGNPSITVPAGQNRVVIVHAATFGSNMIASFNGMSMSVAVSASPSGWVGRSTIFYLPLGTGPAITASANVTGGGGGGPAKHVWVGSFHNVDQTTPIAASGSATNLGASTTIGGLTTMAAMDILLDGINTTNPATGGSPQGGGTRIQDASYSSNAAHACARYRQSVGGTESMVWNYSGGPDRAHTAIAINGIPPCMDMTAPSITCIGNQNINFDASCQASLPDYTMTVLVTDDCGIATFVQSPAPGTMISTTTAVTLTATDFSGKSSMCNFNVTPVDNTPPVLTCPANIMVNNTTGMCGASVTYTAPSASDNCTSSLTVVCSPPSGSFFPVGTTTVTCTSLDAAGNMGMCTFTVTVNDAESPTITCPGNITQDNDAGQCGAIVTFSPMIGDNCSGATVTCVPASGSFFPVGTTSVTCTVTDGAGNMNMCSFNVTVNDTEDPVITCPANIMQINDVGQCGAIVTFTPMISDNCPGSTVLCSPASGSFFSVGTTMVTCTVTDVAGNQDVCIFNVTVNDAEAPMITCPMNITQANDAGQCGAIVTFTPMISDNCPGATVTCVPASGSFFPVGTTPVSCTVTDAAGLTSMCSFNVTVNDTENPTITCPANISVNNDPGTCGAVVTYATPVIGDNCPGTTVSCVPVSGSVFPVGTTTVNCTATDAVGNTNFCSFSVTVMDNEPPVWQIADMGNVLVDNDPGTGPTDSYNLGNIECDSNSLFTATGIDNCEGSITNSTAVQLISLNTIGGNAVKPTTVNISDDMAGNYTVDIVWGLGTTTVVLSMMDAVGNSSNLTLVATTTDTEPPFWTLYDATSTAIADNDPTSVPVTSYTEPMLVLDPSICGVHSTYTADGVDSCFGQIFLADALSVANIVSGSTFAPTTASVMGDGAGNYSIDIFWGVGTSTVTLAMMDPQGNSSNLTIQATVNDPLAGNIAPNAHDLNLSLDVSGNVSFQLLELAGNVSCSDPVDVLVETESGIKVFFGQGLIRSDYIQFAACIYRGRKLKATVTGPGGSAWGYLTIHDGLLPIIAPGRSKDVYCFDPLVKGGAIDGKLPEAYSPCIGPLVVNHAADWIKPYECGPPFSASNDTVKVIYREYETFDKNGNRASVIDTITVFGLPPISVLTSVNAYCAEKDTTYCGEGFAGPYMVFPERCEPSLPLGPGNDPDMDGSFCDTLYFLVYDSLMNMWVENPVFAESKCGISVHLDKKTFGSNSCEQQTKYILQIKQDCIGTPQPSCIIDPALWPDNAFEEVATGYFQCEFWLIDLDTVAPWIKIKEPAVWASTSDHECAAHTYISPLYVHDDWSGVKQVKARIEGVGSYLLNYNTENKCYESHTLSKLPYKEGPYYVVYEAYDSCHNMYA